MAGYCAFVQPMGDGDGDGDGDGEGVGQDAQREAELRWKEEAGGRQQEAASSKQQAAGSGKRAAGVEQRHQRSSKVVLACGKPAKAIATCGTFNAQWLPSLGATHDKATRQQNRITHHQHWRPKVPEQKQKS
ncbi:hypothetical protein AWZ03_005063 [Drosophila navojoa]|uniref:Uncharacterized protein n=1 Tax=Drosophila navojoa TaxID=7232 RepID=A0A484BIA4_DRONA|nr:hypothetical protein AWZ03_005063 [Drosophila navojoa]